MTDQQKAARLRFVCPDGVVRDITAKFEHDGKVDSQVVEYALIQHYRNKTLAEIVTADLRASSLKEDSNGKL